jgi:hypothetical protein
MYLEQTHISQDIEKSTVFIQGEHYKGVWLYYTTFESNQKTIRIFFGWDIPFSKKGQAKYSSLMALSSCGSDQDTALHLSKNSTFKCPIFSNVLYHDELRHCGCPDD